MASLKNYLITDAASIPHACIQKKTKKIKRFAEFRMKNMELSKLIHSLCMSLCHPLRLQ